MTLRMGLTDLNMKTTDLCPRRKRGRRKKHNGLLTARYSLGTTFGRGNGPLDLRSHGEPSLVTTYLFAGQELTRGGARDENSGGQNDDGY